MKDALRIDTSSDLATIALKLFAWVVVLSVAMWLALALASLRFDISGSFAKLFYSQLIIGGVTLAGALNAIVAGRGGFGARSGGDFLRPIALWAPALWATVTIAGLLMLAWQVWVEFNSANAALKAMFSLLGVGLCGTYAGLVSLAVTDREYAHLKTAIYILTAIVGAEVVEGLWFHGAITAASTGGDFAQVGTAVGANMAVYAALAALLSRISGKLGERMSPAVYAAAGLTGFALTLFTLFESFDPGPFRFILGSAVLLSSASVALGLMHYQRRRSIQESERERERLDDSPLESAADMGAG